MYLKPLPIFMVVVWLLVAACVRAQDNPMEDADLQQLLKQAQEMQKNARDLQKNPGSRDTGKKLADLEATAKEQLAQQERKNAKNKNCRPR